MPISEAARADLYTGLAEAIGPERAETLMAQLPRCDPDQVALKSDIAEFRAETKAALAEFRAEFKSELAEFRTEFREGLAAVNQRMDRLFLTMLVGTFGIVATMLGVILSIR